MKKVVIIDYGAGNIQSLQFALEKLGVKAVLSNNSDEIAAAEKVFFPGVGHASYAMEQLKRSGLDKIIQELKSDVLGICLGMQLMCSSTSEGNVEGLDIFDTKVEEFELKLKVPHMGWNKIQTSDSPLFKDLKEPYMYFVHSFFANRNKHEIAVCDYGISFSAALAKDNFFGCQFHPEKSGPMGLKIIQNFLEL
jgi:glutamine amidotransferase